MGSFPETYNDPFFLYLLHSITVQVNCAYPGKVGKRVGRIWLGTDKYFSLTPNKIENTLKMIRRQAIPHQKYWLTFQKYSHTINQILRLLIHCRE